MALNHTDTELQSLKINNFQTLADYQAAYDQGLIDENEISFIDESLQADWNQTIGTAPDYIKNKPTISYTGRTLCFGGEPVSNYMYLEAAQANSTVSLVSTLPAAPDLEYSTDGQTWQEWQHTTAGSTHTFNTLTLTAVGDRVYLRGDNPDGLGFYDDEDEILYYSIFSLTGSIRSGGNVMSLLDKTMVITEVPDAGFIRLFDNYYASVPLLTVPDMSTITAIGERGCENMYERCSITAAADMPSLITIGNEGCVGMYSECSSITAAADMPSLTAIGYYGCYGMYNGCTFAMSDNGATLNFDFPTPPITTVGYNPQTYATAYDIAQWMGNTHGFEVA